MSNTDEIYDELTQNKKTKDKKKKIVIQQKQYELDLVHVMSSTQGRNVIWSILSLRGPYTSSYSPNPYEMAFNEGNRNIACHILDELIRVCPEHYLLAQQEAITREKGLENE